VLDVHPPKLDDRSARRPYNFDTQNSALRSRRRGSAELRAWATTELKGLRHLSVARLVMLPRARDVDSIIQFVTDTAEAHQG